MTDFDHDCCDYSDCRLCAVLGELLHNRLGSNARAARFQVGAEVVVSILVLVPIALVRRSH